MEVALYVRVSTTRQQQAQTIDQQLVRLRAHVAAQPDWHLAEEHIYRDDGYSGTKLSRPGLDRLRDHAALAAFERVLLTAPDRLARTYVHQVLLIDELAQRGCPVEFVERPMSDDPHDQLVLQIRGAVAEYERTLIADRMRRGRQAKLRSGQLLPWTRAPYGYILDAERPRDPSRVRRDPVAAAIVAQIFAWYTDAPAPLTLYGIAKRLSDEGIPTPSGKPRWNVASIRDMLRSPAYTGTAYSGRTRPAPARHRKSALRPVGPGYSHAPTPPEEWIAIPVPAIVSQATFDAAQAQLDRNTRLARRNNTAHDYLLRGLVSCGRCRLACTGRSRTPGSAYYICRGHTDALRAAQGERCTARFAPAAALDDLVWHDLCQVISEPALLTHELARAQQDAWLPQALHARQQTVQAAVAHLERQQERLLDAYLAAIISRDEFARKRQEILQTLNGLAQQLRQLDAQVHHQQDITAVAQGMTTFCRRLQPTLDRLTFAQRRQLVELLIDRVIVTDGQVEIRYVIPTGPRGEATPFCHLRLDYFNAPALPVERDGVLRGQAQRIALVGQVALPGALIEDADQAQLLALLAAPDPDEGILPLRALPQHALDLAGQVALGAGDDGDVGQGQAGEDADVGVAQVEDEQRPGGERGQDVRPGALVMRLRVGLVPQVPRQARAQIEQGGHAPGQGRVGPVAQQADLTQQRVQGRAVGGEHRRVAVVRPSQFGRQGPAALRPARLHRGEQVVEHAPEQGGGERAQPVGERLLADADGRGGAVQSSPSCCSRRTSVEAEPTCRQIMLSTRATMTGSERTRWRKPRA